MCIYLLLHSTAQQNIQWNVEVAVFIAQIRDQKNIGILQFNIGKCAENISLSALANIKWLFNI